jgi:HK97 family phage prohead protease
MARLEKTHSITITRLKGNTGRAVISAYGNVDHQGDRVMPGAFTQTIADWEASGDPCPFVWAHEWSDPFAHVGVVRKFTDTPQGLVVDFEIDTSTDFAKQVVKLLDERRITKMSFAYDVLRETKGSDGANELLELRLLECGPCLSPANEEAVLLSRKSVQSLLARETNEPMWAGTTVPQRDVDDLRSKMSGLVEGFLDGVFDAASKMPAESEVRMTSKNTEIDRLNAEIDGLTTSPDADLLRKLDEIDKFASGSKQMVTGEYAAVLQTAAAHLAQSAAAAQRAGLPDAEAALMEASRTLRSIASGSEEAGRVEDVISTCSPLVTQLRTSGLAVAGDSLERSLVELAGGVRVDYVENADRVEGSVNVDTPKSTAVPLRDGPSTQVDSRLRPVGEPRAPIPVESREVLHLPVYVPEDGTWRVEQDS